MAKKGGKAEKLQISKARLGILKSKYYGTPSKVRKSYKKLQQPKKYYDM